MKLPCAVVRDLLPLYAEKLTEDETKELVDGHLEDCAECRRKLAEIDTRIASPAESAKPLMALKKEIRKRRRMAALMAALCVFIGLFSYFYHVTGMKYVPWQEGLITVAGVKACNPAEDNSSGDTLPEDNAPVPAPTEAPATDGSSGDALILNVSSFINGFSEHAIVEEDGTTTIVMQAVSTNQGSGQQPQSYYEMTYYPVPDRLIYGFEQPQKLLWGSPLNGGMEVLPRLALAYYLILAAALAVLSGVSWAIFRKWRSSRILRQLFFAPVSYILSHLLLKGMRTDSFFMERDFISIMIIAVALYVLLSLAWQIWLKYKKAI